MMKINKKSNQMNINNNDFNIILKPHQKSLIYKALQIDGKFNNKEFKYGMFSDPPGTGKTFVILALIYFIKLFENKRDNCFLIVVPHNIFSQWIESINKIYKNEMKCKFISENKDINALYNDKYVLMDNDIILITPVLYISLVQAISYHNFYFRSVFFDEIDTIQNLLKHNILTQMVWFISASIHSIFDENNLSFTIGSYNLYLPNLKQNDCSCEIKYIKKCMKIKPPNYKKFICKNKYVDNIFSKFCQKQTMNGINTHHYNILTKECGNVDLNSYKDVLSNLYSYSIKLMSSKLESITETEKYIKFNNNGDKESHIISKNKLVAEHQELKALTDILKNLFFNNLVCIKCFNNIQDMELENEYKNNSIDYYITPNNDNICNECIYELIKYNDDENIDDTKIKIEYIGSDKIYRKDELTSLQINKNDNEFINLDKMTILKDILDLCKNKIILYCSTRKELNNYLENYYNEKIFSYLELNGGNIEDLTNIVNKFKNDNTIKLLFINDLSLSNGLNLEFVDDLILFNYLEPKTLDQVIGRVLRYPRTKKLNIYQLLYKNENN